MNTAEYDAMMVRDLSASGPIMTYRENGVPTWKPFDAAGRDNESAGYLVLVDMDDHGYIPASDVVKEYRYPRGASPQLVRTWTVEDAIADASGPRTTWTTWDGWNDDV